VSEAPYASVPLSDPITAGQLSGLGFLWGGTEFGDGQLDCNPSTVGCTSVPIGEDTVYIPGNTDGPNYLNVVLDTVTLPERNHAYPSWGTITIKAIVPVPEPLEP
jgi:hypothetical protein